MGKWSPSCSEAIQHHSSSSKLHDTASHRPRSLSPSRRCMQINLVLASDLSVCKSTWFSSGLWAQVAVTMQWSRWSHTEQTSMDTSLTRFAFSHYNALETFQVEQEYLKRTALSVQLWKSDYWGLWSALSPHGGTILVVPCPWSKEWPIASRPGVCNVDGCCSGQYRYMPAIDHVNRGTVELIRSFLRCNIALNRKTHSLHFSKIKQTPTGNHCFGAAKILRILCSGSFSGLDHQPDEFEVQMRRHVLCSDPLDSALHFLSIYQVICVLHSPERFGGIK